MSSIRLSGPSLQELNNNSCFILNECQDVHCELDFDRCRIPNEYSALQSDVTSTSSPPRPVTPSFTRAVEPILVAGFPERLCDASSPPTLAIVPSNRTLPVQSSSYRQSHDASSSVVTFDDIKRVHIGHTCTIFRAKMPDNSQPTSVILKSCDSSSRERVHRETKNRRRFLSPGVTPLGALHCSFDRI